jgi:hypothetical protein
MAINDFQLLRHGLGRVPPKAVSDGSRKSSDVPSRFLPRYIGVLYVQSL